MDELLEKKIRELPFSDEFKDMAEYNDLQFVRDIIQLPFHHLPSLPLSGYRMVKEVLVLLEREGLMELVEP